MERSIWIATLLLYGLVLVLAAGACGSVTPVRDSAGAPDGNGPDGGAAAVDAGPPELPPSLDCGGRRRRGRVATARVQRDATGTAHALRAWLRALHGIGVSVAGGLRRAVSRGAAGHRVCVRLRRVPLTL